MLAACSRQAIRFCYRCNSLQCRLGSLCSNCTALSQQPCLQKAATAAECPSVRQGWDFRPSLTAYCIAIGLFPAASDRAASI